MPVPSNKVAGDVITADHINSIAATVNTLENVSIVNGATPYVPQTGGWLLPSHVTNTSTGTPASGNCDFMPFNINTPLSFQAMGVQCTTAQSGGGLTISLGLYADDGTMGAPLLTPAGLLYSGTIISNGVLTTGKKLVTTAINLQPGRYWAAYVQVQNSSVSTNPQFNCINTNIAMWHSDAIAIGTLGRAIRVASATGLPTTTQTFTVNGGTTTPVVCLKRA